MNKLIILFSLLFCLVIPASAQDSELLNDEPWHVELRVEKAVLAYVNAVQKLDKLQTGNDAPVLKSYTVKPGKQKFRPINSVLPKRMGKKLCLVFDPSAWWGFDDWDFDKDYFDWNKGPGYTAYLSKSNATAYFIAWRPDPIRRNQWQVAFYTNDKKTEWKVSDFLTVQAGEMVQLNVNPGKRNIAFQLITPNDEIEGSHPWKSPWYGLYRRAGMWVGGANNATGPYGGAATQYMTLFADFKKK